MKTALPLLMALVAASPLHATVHPPRTEAPDVLDLLRRDRAAGRIDADGYFVECFRAVFAPEKRSARYRGAPLPTSTCWTPQVAEYSRLRSILTPDTIEEIDRYIVPARGQGWFTYVSASGRFQLHYTISGIDAVNAADEDPANGIPDVVEYTAEYADISWATEADSMGFRPPPLPADGTYDITFMDLGLGTGLLGYTYTTGPSGETAIVIRDRMGPSHLIPVEDPEGQKKGRAKATVSHEFKHASQYVGSSWSEGNWVELDANWVMDSVFDEHNAYKAFINPDSSGGQLANPEQSLDQGGGGGYRDLLWEQYLSERYGVPLIVDFWERRVADPLQAVLDTYQDAQLAVGASWASSYPEFMEWCWFGGIHSKPGVGFEEASGHREMALREPTVATYPHTAADAVSHLAAHARLLEPGQGIPRVDFNGDDSATGLSLSILIEEPDGDHTVLRPGLDAGNDVDVSLPLPWAAISHVSLIVVNASSSGPEVGYTVSILDDPATATPRNNPDNPALAVSPNPFHTTTVARFRTATGVPRTATVHDVLGRVVRTLSVSDFSGSMAEVAWHGRDDAGRRMPAGAYWIRVQTAAGGSVAKRIILLR